MSEANEMAKIVLALDALAKQTPILSKIEVHPLDYFLMKATVDRAVAQERKDSTPAYLGIFFGVDLVTTPSCTIGKARLIDSKGKLMKEIRVSGESEDASR